MIQITTLIDLLDLWGFDLRVGASSPVRILRHAGQEGVPRRLYGLGIDEFESYQASQKKLVFGDAKILVSFIKTEGYEADFIGVYRVHGHQEGRTSSPLPKRLPEELAQFCTSRYHYSLARDTEFDQFRGRIRIEWDKQENRWFRQNLDANRRIVAVKDPTGKWVTPTGRESLLNLKVVPAVEQSDLDWPSSYKEGGRNLRSHSAIERNGTLIRDSKARFKKLHGRLFCQACEFDFLAVYGEDYIECHHTIPVHKLPSNGFTSIEDVALLCANCHRIIHRRREWMSIDQLVSLLANRKS